MSSSNSKRRKVTVDIKQTKLERGSVFARLGNKDKLKKRAKGDTESSSKSKKESSKQESPVEEEKKRPKQSSKSEEVGYSSKKTLKEHHSHSGTSKSSKAEYETKEAKKSHRFSEGESERDGSSRSRSKHKSDRHEQKIDNLIIEKQISPTSSSRDQSHSLSPSAMPTKKKSKKHSSRHASREKSAEQHERYLSLSPDRPLETPKHKDRGRSREKKKSSKESSKRSKETYDEERELEPKSHTSKHSYSKGKKSTKHVKHDRDYVDEFEGEKKHSKSKHARSTSQDTEHKSRPKISPVVYEHSSDDQPHGKKYEKVEDRSKPKRRKHEDNSPSDSPVRYKKSKREQSFEDNSKGTPSPVKASKKKSSKDHEVGTKKKVHKEDSLQGTYSDYSSNSKHSQPEYSEISQISGGNEDQYSSDSYAAEKEPKKKSKMKKKTKKDVDSFSSKARYEVIDDDFSDEGKKVKKRKRKREEISPYVESPARDEGKYSEKEKVREEPSKKKVERSAHSHYEKIRSTGTDKYTSERQDSFEQQSSSYEHRESSSRRQKFSSDKKAARRTPEESYYEPKKVRDVETYDRRKDVYPEHNRSREQRYSPERREREREPMYSKSNPPSRFPSERGVDSKAMDWQRKGSRHISAERKETIPRLMSQYPSDHRGEGSRPSSSKYPPQRKMHEVERSYHHESLMGDSGRTGHGSLDRSSRNTERRPPPLLPPNFTRNRSPAHAASHNRDGRGFIEQDHGYIDNERKPQRRDPLPRTEMRDRKYQPMHDDAVDRQVRSSSRDSRTSLRHSSHDAKNRHHAEAPSSHSSIQSPRSDRNSSLERREYKKPHLHERAIHSKNEHQSYDRHMHHSADRAKVKNSAEHMDRGRPSQRSRPLKRTIHERNDSHRATSSQDRVKKTRLAHPTSPSKRKPKDGHTSAKRAQEKDGDKSRTSRKASSSKKSIEGLSDEDIDELIKDEDDTKSQEVEVDWTELSTASPVENETVKQPSSVLSKFSPGNILRQSGIIMDMLPAHLIEKINKVQSESAEQETSTASNSVVSKLLSNGLNTYSDMKLRKYFLGYNISNRHTFCPPYVINGRTYSASMKEYMRKMRMVEPV